MKYQDYIESFINIKDESIKRAVSDAIAKGKLWKEPLIQFNPSFDTSESITGLWKKIITTITEEKSAFIYTYGYRGVRLKNMK